MKIETRQCDYITISGADRLDPIKVFFEDTAEGAGQITVTCYGSAWSAYFGAMGDRNIKQFALSASADYLAGAMLSTIRKATKREEQYLKRIVLAVQDVLRGII